MSGPTFGGIPVDDQEPAPATSLKKPTFGGVPADPQEAPAAPAPDRGVLGLAGDALTQLMTGAAEGVTALADAPRRAANFVTQNVGRTPDFVEDMALDQGGAAAAVLRALNAGREAARIEKPEAQAGWERETAARVAEQRAGGTVGGQDLGLPALTPAAVQAEQQLAGADGAGETVRALLQNPGILATEGARMVGQMGAAAPAALLGPAAGLAAFGGQAGSMTAGQIGDTIAGADLALLRAPDAELVAAGMSPEQITQGREIVRLVDEARAAVPQMVGQPDDVVLKYIADTRGTQAFGPSAVVNSVLQLLVPGGTAIERALGTRVGAAAGTRLGGAATGFAGEAVTEGAQGAIDQVLQNIGTAAPVGDDVAKNALLEALIAGPLGAGAGALNVDPRTAAGVQGVGPQQPAAAPPQPPGDTRVQEQEVREEEVRAAEGRAAPGRAGEAQAEQARQVTEPPLGGAPQQDLTPRAPAAAPVFEGETREQLIAEYRAAQTAEQRAAAAARIAAFDQRDAADVQGTGNGGRVFREPELRTGDRGVDAAIQGGREADQLGSSAQSGALAASGDRYDAGQLAAADGDRGAGVAQQPTQDDAARWRRPGAGAGVAPPAQQPDAEGGAGPEVGVRGGQAPIEGGVPGQAGMEAGGAAGTGIVDEVSGRQRGTASPAVTAAVAEVLGDANRQVNIHASAADIDPEVARRVGITSEANADVEGFYDPKTGNVHIIESALDTSRMDAPSRAAWVAAHERAGHAGLRGLVASKAEAGAASSEMVTLLDRARQNDTVSMIADRIAAEHGYDGTRSTEEAIVELQAAVRTGKFEEIEQRYGVKVPQAQRGQLRAYIDRLVQAIKRAFGRAGQAFTDADVHQLLDDAWRYAKSGRDTRAGKTDELVAQRAFHGTPTRGIDRFSLDKIGTGEGNQAFGWGMYFAGNRNVADQYRRGLSAIGRRPGGTLADILIQKTGAPRGALEILARMRRGTVEQGERITGRIWQTKEAMLREIDGAEAFIRANNNRGQLYQQELPEDSELLYYDAPIGGQSDAVFDAVRGLVQSNNSFSGKDWRRMTGGQFYNELALALGGQRQASESLLEAGVPGLRYADGDSRNRDGDRTYNYVIWDESSISAPEALIASRTSSGLLRNLTPAEQKKVTDKAAAKIIDLMRRMPPRDEMAAVAYAGRAKRGWYKQSAEAISAVFGPDAPRFAGLLAAMSPQTSVESNLRNALNTWSNWVEAGRPTDREEIIDIMGRSVEGSRGRASVLGAWINNSVAALASEDPTTTMLSGPKVDSFMRNLMGNTQEVTNDAWMASFAAIEQTLFKGGKTKSDPGKGTGYLAMNARTRETAARLSKLTGDEWTPAEVQETVWSWSKTLYELADSADEIRNMDELIQDRAVTDELLQSTPDFGTLFADPQYAAILGDRYEQQVERIRAGRDHARNAVEGEESAPGAEAGPFDPETQRRLERRSAQRLDSVRRARRDADRRPAEEVTDDEAIPFSRRGPATINVGLDVPTGGKLKRQAVLAAVKRTGAKVLRSSVHVSDTEPTLVADLDRALTPDEGAALSTELRQEAIAQRYDDGTGDLFGPQAEAWGPFNPEFFIRHDGRRASYDLINEAGKAADRRAEAARAKNEASMRRLDDAVASGEMPWINRPRAPMRSGFAFQKMASDKEALEMGSDVKTDRDGNSYIIASRGFSAKPRQPDAVSVDAYHYSSEPDLDELDPRMAGSANAGRERRRFGTGTFGKQGGTAARLGFYVREPGAPIPQPEDVVVGRNLYRVQLDNLYDGDNDPRGIVANTRNADEMEEEISDAGFDGFYYRDPPGIDQPVAVVFDIPGKIPVEAVDEPIVASRAVTQTPEFKRWFGDSKVVDENGEPLVVYHGTNWSFDTFVGDNAGAGWFAEDPEMTGRYSVDRAYDEEHAPTTYPVYLSIKNPLVLEFDMNHSGRRAIALAKKLGVKPSEYYYPDTAWELINTDVFSEAARRAGYDGIKVKERGLWTWNAFDSTQIKSATGNSGAFDPANPSIIASRRTPAQARAERQQLLGHLGTTGFPQGQTPPAMGQIKPLQAAADEVRRKLQDKMLPLLRAQERAGGQNAPGVTSVTLDDAMNAYRLETLMHGAIKDAQEGAEQKYILPLQRRLKNIGMSVETFEGYLLARAAEEVNKAVAAIPGAMQDSAAGITTAEAKAVLAGTGANPYTGKPMTAQELQQAGSLVHFVDGMRDLVLENMVEAGQITPKLARQLKAKYPHYIPMRGKDVDDWLTRMTGTGKGIGQTKANIKRRLGRGQDNLPINILGEMAGDVQRSIIARGKMKPNQALLRFLLANPMPELATIEPVDLEWKFSEATGEAYLGVKGVTAEDSERTILVMHDGNPVRIRFEDEHLRDAVMNMGPEDMRGFVRWVGAINRWRSAVLTRFNPAFTPINILRDLQFGTVAMLAERGVGFTTEAALNYAPAMRALWRDNRRRRGDSSVPDAQKTMDDWAREASEAGMRTGLTQVDDVADLQRRMQNGVTTMMQLVAEGKPWPIVRESVTRSMGPVIRAIEDVNDSAENALRLAAYVASRKRGDSVERAAEYAKNLTINFNRKGQYGSLLNAIFLFYNASVQGTHAVVRVMRNPKVVAYLGAMAGLQAMMAATMIGSDDDDDGVTQWDMVPDYVKRTSLVIPINGGEAYFALPMPFGFNLFTYAGGRTAQQYEHGDRPTDTSIVSDVLKSAVESFSPVPIDEGYGAMFGDQLGFAMQLATNKDDLGRPIAAENPYAEYEEPRALTGRADTPRAYHSTAQLLAKLGGGNLEKRIPPVGYLDVAPEQLESVVNYVGGGLTGLVNKSFRWWEQLDAKNLETGMDVAAATPIISRMVGKPNAGRAIAERYYGERGELARARDVMQDRIEAGEDPQKVLKEAGEENPLLAGQDVARYKRKTKSKTGGKTKRVGDVKTTPQGGVELEAAEDSITSIAKSIDRRVKGLGKAIRALRDPELTNKAAADLVSNYGFKADDIGLPKDFDDVDSPNRVRQRAIKLLQDRRTEAQGEFLKAIRFQRRYADAGAEIERLKASGEYDDLWGVDGGQ